MVSLDPDTGNGFVYVLAGRDDDDQDIPLLGGPPEGSCSSHGVPTCSCNYGFTGAYCETPVDWCDENLIPELPKHNETNPLMSEACQPNGNCTSTPEGGARCVCKEGSGYSGLLCKDAERILRSCIRFQPANPDLPEAQEALQKYPVGCDFMNTEDEEWACLPNSLSCLKSEWSPFCDVAVGWCLPKDHVAAIQNQATTGSPGATNPPPPTTTTAKPTTTYITRDPDMPTTEWP